jgi:hypothetical protein
LQSCKDRESLAKAAKRCSFSCEGKVLLFCRIPEDLLALARERLAPLGIGKCTLQFETTHHHCPEHR